MIVSYNNGAPVRLGDVGTVTDSVEDIRNIGLSGGKPAVLIIVFRQPGANIIATVDRVRAALPLLKSSISPAIDVNVVLDRTTTVRASVQDIEFTLLISVVLVILVVFAFLRTFRATLIPSVAVPMSLIGTFGVMYLLNYSLDNLSLMALAISTGFVVDDAIVVLENITRHIEEGGRPVDAAFMGAREIGFTVLSMSMSLVAVFIPILLMGGIVGRLFREFAVTLSVAIAVSLLVSLTVTPMMCAKFLRSAEKEKHGRIYRFSEKIFDTTLRMYSKGLKVVLRHQPLTLLITIGTAALSIYLYIIVPKGFFPQQDTGRLQGAVQAAQDISFAAMKDKMTQFVGIVMKDPAVETIVGFAGGNTSANQGRMFVTLKPLAERKISADQVIGRLRRQLAVVPGATLYMQSAQDLTIGGRQSQAQFQYTLQGENLSDLNYWSPLLLQKLRSLPELRDVNTDQQDKGLEATVIIDRDTASRLGVNAADIDNALYDAFGQRQVSIMYKTPEPISRGHGSGSGVFQQHRRAAEYLCSREQRHTGSAGRVCPLWPFQHASGGKPSGAISGGDVVVQSRAQRVFGPGHGRDQQCATRHQLSSHHRCQLPGNGSGLPDVAGQRAVADSGGAGHGVPGSGHALRKLHPSHHHSFHTAFRRRGRDPGASVDAQRAQRDGTDRHPSADRHRKEERHHDD